VVLISSVTKNYNIAVRHAQLAKRFGLPVIIGGIHISAIPQSLTADMDVGCLGEGEQTFLELIELLLETGQFHPSRLQDIHGIVYHGENGLAQTAPRAQFQEIDQLPHPDRSLIGYRKRDYVFTSRGCQYNCVFCSSTRHWGKVRYATPGYVLEELDELVRNGTSIIRFNDDDFTARPERVLAISEGIIARGHHRRVKFSCWSRANNLTRETAAALKAMNMVSVLLGLESGSDRILKFLKNGRASVEGNRRAIGLLKDADIQANADFIIGSPDETAEEMMETYRFIKDSRLDFVTINMLSALPGTALWSYAEDRNLVSPAMDWQRMEYKFSPNRDNIILSERVSHRELKRIHRKFLWLCFFKALRALPRSPWRSEIPFVALRRLRQTLKGEVGFDL
jgi:anaerobic magnesium-protoporphyrin IX monomethyl ester cyclase